MITLNTYASTKENFLIVLSLNEIKVDQPFINITHLQLIKKIQDRMGSVIDTSNLKNLTLLQDFIQHIHRYYQKRIEMNALNYLFENGEQINKIKTLEQEGLKYISDEIGKILNETNWVWGRIIPSGLQIQRKDSPIIGYIYFNKIYSDKEIGIELWLKGAKYVKARQDQPIPSYIIERAKSKNLILKESENTKEWYNLAQKSYPITSINQLEDIGNEILNVFQSDWEDFCMDIEKTYIAV